MDVSTARAAIGIVVMGLLGCRLEAAHPGDKYDARPPGLRVDAGRDACGDGNDTVGREPQESAGGHVGPAGSGSSGGRTACDWRLRDGLLVSKVDHEHYEIEPREVDLNGDRYVDRIGFLGACGNWGDCRYVVLEACEGGGYRVVWGPDYAQGVGVGSRPPEASRANLVIYGRTGSAGCDLSLRTILKWTPGGWSEHTTCAGGGMWDEEICGERPPSCTQ